MSSLLWSLALPALITALLPSHITPTFASQLTLFGLLFYLGREVRLHVREYLIGRRALACGARLAPLVHSPLPFGLSIVFHRFKQLATGTPTNTLDLFKGFPEDTKVIRTRALGIEVVHTRSHLDAKHVLVTDFANWGKSPNFLEAFEPLLGEGVFASDQRSLWSWHRSLTRPHFSRERVADVASCEQHVSRVVTWLERKAKADEMVDIQEAPVRWFLKKFPNKSIQSVMKMVGALIEKTDEKMGSPDRAEHCNSEYLVQHLRREGCPPELLRFESLNILLAARDTISSMLTSCIYELAGRDEIWGRLRAEVAGLPKDTQISAEEIRKLKLLRAVLNETLRLHPPVWMNIRHAFKDSVFPSGIFVPAGTDCRFLIREFQRGPEVWGKDAEEFIPDRWLDGRQAAQSKDPFTYQPFSAGPRICLGQQFAYTEMSIALARLLLAFSKVELAGKSALRENFEEVPSVTLSVRGGLWVKFHK